MKVRAELSDEALCDLTSRGFSRRSFGRCGACSPAST